MAAHRKSKRELTLNQQRQNALLKRRDELGTKWAHSISHSVPGAGGVMMELLITEAALVDNWPHLKGDHASRWVLNDARELHDPHTEIGTNCVYCEQVTAQAAA